MQKVKWFLHITTCYYVQSGTGDGSSVHKWCGAEQGTVPWFINGVEQGLLIFLAMLSSTIF